MSLLDILIWIQIIFQNNNFEIITTMYLDPIKMFSSKSLKLFAEKTLIETQKLSN